MFETTFASYPVTVYDPDKVKWGDSGGVYLFMELRGLTWFPHYIGQTDSFSSRLPSHERWEEAKRQGATHIHTVAIPEEDIRRRVENRLLRICDPPLNERIPH